MGEKFLTKNFVLLIAGQASSLFGNFILRLALSMYVLEETGSAAVFAGILSAAVIPTILLSPFGGILADRLNRRNMMVALDVLAGLSVFAAAVSLNKNNALAVIGVLLVVLSILGAFETPTVQACVPQMQKGDNILKGNAVINQVASLSYLAGPMAGGVLYAAFGLKPVMLASVACFFLTALLECFIKLEQSGHGFDIPDGKGSGQSAGIWSGIREDFSVSVRFLVKEQPDILYMLLLAAFSRFFVMGVTLVGFPYLIRNVLGLGAGHYGAAESSLAVAMILGSIAAGVLAGKLKTRKLSLVLASVGFFMIPAGLAFLFPFSVSTKYLIQIGAFCGVQASISLFSIFAVSLIQQRTPDKLLGKIMAVTSALTMCAQPLGQMAYGFLFDIVSGAVFLVLIPTGLMAGGAGLLSAGFFKRLEKGEKM